MVYIRWILFAAVGFAAGFALSIPVRLQNLRLQQELEKIEKQSVALQAEALERSEQEISRYRSRANASKKQAAVYLDRLEAIGRSVPNCGPVEGLLEPVGAKVLVRVDGENVKAPVGESGVNNEDTIYSVLDDALDGLRKRQSSRN